MLSLFLIIACEHADLQRSSPKDDKKITTRTDDCEDCPVGDCCCFVSLDESPSASLVLCGTSGPEIGTQTCEFDINGCPPTSGYVFATSLTTMNPGAFFCMQKNTAFVIAIQGGTANLKLTCQQGQIGGQVLNIYLSSTFGPNRLYYTVNGDCELTECP